MFQPDWIDSMPNEDESFFVQKTKKAWWWALERYGLPTLAIVVFTIVFARPWWNDYLDAQRSERTDRQALLNAQIEALDKQTEAMQLLVERDIEERKAEVAAAANHETQIQLMSRNNELMEDAAEQMGNVPEQNAEKLSLLREIAEGIKALE